MLKRCLLAGCFLLGVEAQGMIFYNLGNSSNTTDPGTGVPWSSVAKVTNSAGTSIKGSAVYLGNGYMLTANHVDTASTQYVTFDGTTTLQIDQTFFSGSATMQVAPGVDMKIFKLTTNPAITAATLLTTPTEQVASATLVGWGVGRNASSPVGSGTAVNWGGDTSAAKRWGVNAPKVVGNVSYIDGPNAYSYDGIYTFLGGSGPSFDPDGLGDSEAAVTAYDSGSGLFQFIGGTWYLIGLTTVAEVNGVSTFGNDQTSDPRGDANAFVRISSYDTQIMSIIVPEPGTFTLLALGAVMLLWATRRGQAGERSYRYARVESPRSRRPVR